MGVKFGILELDGEEFHTPNEYEALSSDIYYDASKEETVKDRIDKSATPCFSGYDCGEVTTDRTFLYFDMTGGLNVSSVATILFDMSDSDSDTRAFTPSSGEVEVKIESLSWVSFTASLGISSGTSRSVSRAWLEHDDGTGFSTVSGTTVYIYNRTSGSSEGTGSGQALIDLSLGDKIRVRAERVSGTSNIETIGEGSRMSIEPVNSKEDIDVLEIDCGDVGEDATFCNYECGEI